jgi:glucokinase
MLAAKFGLPTFVNNDGALFAYGEALGGLLPFVNGRLAAAGSDRRFRNLLGVTLGTGLGGGLVIDGRLVVGDNAAAGQIWMMRHRDDRQRVAEEGASIRAVRRAYAAAAGLALDQVPDPERIAQIARGEAPGDRRAAAEAFRRLGQVAGDAIANALTLVDGLVVLGGGLSGAAGLFRAALLEELNGTLETSSGSVDRLMFQVLDVDDPVGLATLVGHQVRELPIPGTDQTIAYAPHKLTGIGITRLGTTAAIALGAYAYALGEIGGA